jgi:hypothetical protein
LEVNRRQNDTEFSLNERLFLDGSPGTVRMTNNAHVKNGAWAIKDPAKKAFTLEVRDSGKFELYGTRTAGQVDWQLMATFDAPNNRVAFPGGKVGIGTPNPKAALDVKGNAMVSGTINGEDPRIKFTVGNPREQIKWLAVEKDIGGLCGDDDGCRIRLLMQHEINDQVRTITEEIYIEQPQISNNKEPGLRGWTRQSGGGEYKWILGWTGYLYDLFNPWEWFWARNYRHENAYGTRGPAYTGNDQYKVSFISHPHVTTTVIIYDR